MKSNKNNAFFIYLVATLVLLVPAPGRFACGFILILVFNIQILTGTLFTHAIYNLKLSQYKTVLITLQLVCVTILCKAILGFVCPVMALTLGFLLFIPAASTVLINYLFDKPVLHLEINLKVNMVQSMFFSIFSLVFFLLRDILGYGTITFPSFSGMFVCHLPFSASSYSATAFVATIPGAFILISLILALYVFFMNKINNIERAKK